MAISESTPKSIEQLTFLRATKKSEEVLEGKGKVFPVVKVTDQEILNYPRLTTGAMAPERMRFQEDIRYHPTNGEIYTTSWRNRTLPDHIVEKTAGGDVYVRLVDTPKDYVQIGKGSTNIQFRDDQVPASAKVKELVFSTVYGGLEPAIRQQYHILEKFDEKNATSESHQLRSHLLWIDQTARFIKEGTITKGDLEDIQQDAVARIEAMGLVKAVNEVKQKIGGMTVTAANLDSLNRVNPLVARTRLASAYVASVERSMVAKLITSKFTANVGVLLAERQQTRWILDQVVGELQYYTDLLSDEQLSNEEAMQMARRVTLMSRNPSELSAVRVAPYLIPSRMVSVFLSGGSAYGRENDSAVLGQEFTEDFFERTVEGEVLYPSANYLLSKGDKDGVLQRFRWTKNVLEEALLDNQLRLDDASTQES